MGVAAECHQLIVAQAGWTARLVCRMCAKGCRELLDANRSVMRLVRRNRRTHARLHRVDMCRVASCVTGGAACHAGGREFRVLA